jgi:prepilin-type N-terminal cleavage/methylation domain-containing protein
MNIPRTRSRSESGKRAFTLVELLSVVAIMATVMGILAISLSQTQGRAVQVAAAQVASGLGVARQAAINMNTQSAFVIAPTPAGASAGLLPEEAYRHYAILYSNKTTGNWILAKDWEALAPGAVFFSILKTDYSPINWPTADKMNPPVFQERTTKEMKVSLRETPTKAVGTLSNNTPVIMFNPDGGATRALGQGMAIGLAEGSSDPSGKLVIRSSDNIAYVEVDPIIGKAVVKMREAYAK